MKKRLLASLLSATILLSMTPMAFADEEPVGEKTTAQNVQENTVSEGQNEQTAQTENGTNAGLPVTGKMTGTCGATEADNVTWALTDDDGDGSYTLTISGNGDMADYYAQYVQRAAEFDGDIAPWRRALLSDTNAERTTEDIVPITEVVIDDGVTRIGSGAFAYTELTGIVTFNENVHSYGDGVFAKDASITAVDWTNFKPTVKIKDGWVKSYTEEHIAVPYAFFDGCSSLATSIIDGKEYSGELVLPDSVDAIYVAAFRGTGFSTVDFSDGLANIKTAGSYAISGLENMDEFFYPGDVNFYGMDDEGRNNVIQGGGIKKLTIAKEVTELPAYFCTNTENLTAIEFESGSQLKKIGKMAFYNTRALENIDIPSTVTAIGESAFVDCFSLEKIELGHIEFLGPNTFTRCSSLKTAKIQGSSDVTYPSNMFGTWGTGHSAAPLKTLEIDDGKIQFSLSNQKDSIETIVLGNEVTEIPNNFAANCTKLTSVSLPDALTSVPVNAFKGCSSLEKVDISENSELQSIGSSAFQNSGLTQIYIPKNVTSIGTGAFNRTPITVFDMSDVLAESMTVGDYAINNWYGENEKKPDWKDNFKYIYVSNNGAASSVKAKTSNCNYAFLVTNGGSVDATKTGFAAVYRTGYTAEWYDNKEFSGTAVTGEPVTTKVYYAKWTKSDNVALTATPAVDENGKVSANYAPNGAVTLSVQNPGAGWLYTWMKNGEQISAAGNSLTLYTPSDSGIYSIKVVAGGSSTDVWTSNEVNVTITKAAGAASVNMDGWAYGETAKLPVPASATNGTAGVTYQYKVQNDDDSTYSAAVPTAAGSYTVKATFPATENYEEVTATANFVITKATPAITIKADPAALTGSGTVTLTVEKPEDGEVSVTCDKADVKVTANKESGTFSVTLPNSSETYTFTATVKYGENANYVDGTAPCTVTVTYQSTSHGGGGSSRNNSYAVSTPKVDNGTVTINNGSTAKKGETVTITVKPNEGYEIDKVTVTDSKGNSITVTDKGDGKFSFVMPDSKVDVKATFVKSEVKPDQPSKTGFVDVPENSWYADAADFVAQRGLMSGIGDNLFGGSQNTTRAMLMTILARMDGQDVTGGATWYEKAMNWAKSNGVSDGTMPEKNITREQLATMLYGYAKLKGMDTTQGGMAVREFADYDSISGWAGQSMTWAVNTGILSGRGNNTLAPTAGATRAEMAVMLQQFVGLMEK